MEFYNIDLKKMDKLYLRQNVVPYESLEELVDWDVDEIQAGVYGGGRARIDKRVRSTILKSIDPKEFPDISQALLNLVEVWNPELNANDYVLKEMQFLKYGVGDHFRKHIDHINDSRGGGREYSTSTIISMTEDLTGGDFVIWTPDELYSDTIKLNVGETIFFNAKTTPHQINKVTAGERQVLVCWIHKK